MLVGPFKQAGVATNSHSLKNTKNVLFGLEIAQVFLKQILKYLFEES
jgi:hypothetical protein